MLLTTERFWRIKSIDVVENCSFFDSCKLVKEVGPIVHVAEFDLSTWVEAKTEWKRRNGNSISVLVPLGPIQNSDS